MRCAWCRRWVDTAYLEGRDPGGWALLPLGQRGRLCAKTVPGKGLVDGCAQTWLVERMLGGEWDAW